MHSVFSDLQDSLLPFRMPLDFFAASVSSLLYGYLIFSLLFPCHALCFPSIFYLALCQCLRLLCSSLHPRNHPRTLPLSLNPTTTYIRSASSCSILVHNTSPRTLGPISCQLTERSHPLIPPVNVAASVLLIPFYSFSVNLRRSCRVRDHPV